MNNIYFHPSDKFKTNGISIVFPLELDEFTTDYNLIANILKRGSLKFQSTKEIYSHLQDLYGSVFDIVVSKKGEKLLMNFFMSFLDKRYTLNNEDLWEKALDFLYEIIENNLIVEDQFNPSFFNQEKTNLEAFINSRLDDKDSYVVEKAEELCTEGEPYAIYKYGEINRLNNINNEDLYKLWKTIKDRKDIFVFIHGNYDKEEILKALEKFPTKKNDNSEINQKREELINFKEIQESFKVNQGKLGLCYKTNITIKDDDYFNLAVMNSILGGGTHSKLFNEVREKHSLAYYCYSYVEKYKGLLTIGSGVDFSNFEKTKNIIVEQVEDIKKGKISNEEIEYSKLKIINELKNLKDSQYSIMDYLVSLKIYNVDYTIDSIMERFEQVSKEGIIRAAEKLRLGSIYMIGK